MFRRDGAAQSRRGEPQPRRWGYRERARSVVACAPSPASVFPSIFLALDGVSRGHRSRFVLPIARSSLPENETIPPAAVSPKPSAQARLMNESLSREVQSRRAAQAALGKRDREVERLQREISAYKVLLVAWV